MLEIFQAAIWNVTNLHILRSECPEALCNRIRPRWLLVRDVFTGQIIWHGSSSSSSSSSEEEDSQASWLLSNKAGEWGLFMNMFSVNELKLNDLKLTYRETNSAVSWSNESNGGKTLFLGVCGCGCFLSRASLLFVTDDQVISKPCALICCSTRC